MPLDAFKRDHFDKVFGCLWITGTGVSVVKGWDGSGIIAARLQKDRPAFCGSKSPAEKKTWRIIKDRLSGAWHLEQRFKVRSAPAIFMALAPTKACKRRMTQNYVAWPHHIKWFVPWVSVDMPDVWAQQLFELRKSYTILTRRCSPEQARCFSSWWQQQYPSTLAVCHRHAPHQFHPSGGFWPSASFSFAVNCQAFVLLVAGLVNGMPLKPMKTYKPYRLLQKAGSSRMYCGLCRSSFRLLSQETAVTRSHMQWLVLMFW